MSHDSVSCLLLHCLCPSKYVDRGTPLEQDNINQAMSVLILFVGNFNYLFSLHEILMKIITVSNLILLATSSSVASNEETFEREKVSLRGSSPTFLSFEDCVKNNNQYYCKTESGIVLCCKKSGVNFTRSVEGQELKT